jgi:[ribosomal protein S5]-alanine N-acetyltransferase
MTMRRAKTGIPMASERLVLREFAVTDEDAVHAFAADPLVTQFTDWGPNSIEDTRAFLAEATAQATNPQRAEFTLAAVHASSGRLIGSVAIGVTSVQHRRGEIGFVFHRDVWSQGYATEAAELLLRFGFDHLQLRRISATCHPDNHASARVLQKAGLEYEGRIRSHLLVRGAWRDSLLYAAVNGDR